MRKILFYRCSIYFKSTGKKNKLITKILWSVKTSLFTPKRVIASTYDKNVHNEIPILQYYTINKRQNNDTEDTEDFTAKWQR